ncbi:MAG: RNB domain-containing ribonuclease [Chloroflexota bacterium]
MLSKNSLVLYKGRVAQIHQAGDKLDIELEDGKHVKVRPKDVQLLHPGPVQNLISLLKRRVNITDTLPEEIEVGWELLAGEETTLADLSDLVYGEFTPSTAWQLWQYVSDGLYFQGVPDAITVRDEAEVAQDRSSRNAKATEKRAWSEFVERLQKNVIQSEDERYFKEVAALALGQQTRCRVLQALNQPETPENAHAFLLKADYWDYSQNPYPARSGLPLVDPNSELSALPLEDRRDLTDLSAFAIDDIGSTDPDDAISLDGNRLWVHIADVAALVYPSSPADLEARARGANLYLPEKTIHMLPPKATESLALGLADVSPALSFALDMDDQDQVIQFEIIPSWVKVQRLTYDQVENLLTEPPFAALDALAQRALARRHAQGAVEIDLPENKVLVENGEVEIRPLPKLHSRDIVREAMLMCGQALAQFAQQHDIPFPYSIQPPPEERVTSNTLADMFAQRRMMRPSQRLSEPGAHAGLGLPIYTQATSPLRRYADLVAHQQIRAFIHNEPLLSSQEVLTRIGEAEAVNSTIRRAERLSRKHWTLVYLDHQLDWQGFGVLVELREQRGLILITDLDLEIRLRLPRHYELNDEIPLSLKGVNLSQLDAYFQID